ncbi:MAG: adenosylcobinamide-phosphate synthase CbiB [Burkholderiaceae bacterium]
MSAEASLAVAAAALLAFALDRAFGEPRDRWHPVSWLGRLLAPLGQWALCGASARAQFARGTAAWLLVALAIGFAAGLAQRWLAQALPPALLAVALAVLLKPLVAWRMLAEEVAAVEAALAHSLDAGRTRVARICSRDTSRLDAHGVRETALESLAENFNDSLVAPLFWFAVAGLAGAALYRFANTADAMWGYRGRWEYAGKFAARADDVLSWVPARLAALLIAPPRLWPRLPAQAARTSSPNGGWPMAALALRLAVQLRKPGHYVLNAGAASPSAAHTVQALRICGRAAVGACVLLAAASALRAAAPEFGC